MDKRKFKIFFFETDFLEGQQFNLSEDLLFNKEIADDLIVVSEKCS